MYNDVLPNIISSYMNCDNHSLFWRALTTEARDRPTKYYIIIIDHMRFTDRPNDKVSAVNNFLNYGYKSIISCIY